MSHLPSFDDVRALANHARCVTIYRRFANDALTPVGAYARLHDGQNALLLESVIGGEQLARYSYVAVGPFLHFEAAGPRATIHPPEAVTNPDWAPDGSYIGPGGPLHALERLLGDFRAEPVPHLPRFCGGAVGYVGYDAVRYTEDLPNAPPDDRGLPDLAFDFYDSIVLFDHLQKTVTITAHARVPSTPDPAELRRAYDAACRRIDAIARRLLEPAAVVLDDIDPTQRHKLTRGFDRSSFEPAAFINAVERCKEYIRAGDIFQVVLSQRLETETAATPFSIYRALRVLNPSPFMFHLRIASPNAPALCLVGSSPELMVRVEDRAVTIHPIAGTRPRAASPEEDDALERDLLADPKERAEHIMLVDLGRNDVGRVADYNSVQLTNVMKVERYSHVMHITTNVSGRLTEGKTAFDALRACLPAGTVSGAPKVRAMQIIDEIEPVRRGPYAGAVGFIDFTGNMETCLALRTLVMQGRKVYLQAGAGLVYDSVPETEYQETLNKAKALLKAIEVAEGWRYAAPGTPAPARARVLSCVQPTGELHIGNDFGAIANWVALQDKHECFYGIVDLHALTTPCAPEQLRANTARMVIDLLACGIDPEKSTLFLQSLVPEHAELAWLLGCLCTHDELARMAQYQERSRQAQGGASAGLFVYPVLQAADVLCYRARFVPVGDDQEQHLGLARELARRFNAQYGGDFFPEPQPLFTQGRRIMSLTDPDRKMSKSAGPGHYIGLFEDDAAIRAKIDAAVVEPVGADGRLGPGVANLLAILDACGKTADAASLRADLAAGRALPAPLKAAVADALIARIAPRRTRRREIERDPDAVQASLRAMSEKARDLARETLREVRARVGLPQ